MLALILAAVLATQAPIRPDPNLTPGVVDPSATLAKVCVDHYDLQPGVRHVTAATKAKVYAEYGYDEKRFGPAEVDHLISIVLGGSNDIKNLWPQSYVSKPLNAHVKDQLEVKLHHLTCDGKLSLVAAQQAISKDWVAAYQTYVGPLPK